MTKKILAVLPLTFLLALSAPAQQPSPGQPPAYRIKVTILQKSGPKPWLAQHFAFTLRPGAHGTVDSGDRVPLAAGDKNVTYVPVGTDIVCTLPSDGHAASGQLSIDLDVKLSSVVGAEHSQTLGDPVLRNAEASVATSVPLGTTETVANLGDQTTDSSYAVQVTAAAENVAAK